MIVQIHGLHKTGTNYFEYILLNAFEEITYKRKQSVGNIPGLANYKRPCAYKHRTPNQHNFNNFIITYRPMFSWLHSMKKENWLATIKAYNHFYASIPTKGNVLILDAEDVRLNYWQAIDTIANTFNLTPKKHIEPTKYLNRGAVLTDKPFLGRDK